MSSAWENFPDINTTNINNAFGSPPKIAICIPYNGSWRPEWVEKTFYPLKYHPTDFCNKLTYMSKVPSLPVARDVLVRKAIESHCDYVFWMDTDHVFEQPEDPNIALKILYSAINKNKDKNSPNYKSGKIVGGVYRAKQKIGFNYAMWMRHKKEDGTFLDDKFAPVQSWTGNWLNVDVIGFGCCLIDINVFKDLQRPWFYWEDIDGISEDFYFCRLAREKGYDIHVHTDVKLSHIGNVKIKTDGTFCIEDI
jgi:hypothetical protein